jgi:hypothetical protein
MAVARVVGRRGTSPEITDKIRDGGAAVLAERGIVLPESVMMRVLDSCHGNPTPILRVEFSVRGLTIFADWDPQAGASVRARAPYE